MRRTQVVPPATVNKVWTIGHERGLHLNNANPGLQAVALGQACGDEGREEAIHQCTDCIGLLIHCTILKTVDPSHLIFLSG